MKQQLDINVDSNTTLNLEGIPQHLFVPSTCDMALKINVPSSQETVNLKMWVYIAGGGGQGGTYTHFNLLAELDKECNEVITIIPYSNSTQLESLFIYSGVTERQSVRLVTKGSGFTGASYVPTYVEIYCGKNLITTIGSKSSSAAGLNNNDYFGLIVITNGSFEQESKKPKNTVAVSYNTNSTYVIPLIEIEDNSSLNGAFAIPIFNINNKKYKAGIKIAKATDIIASYKAALPEVITDEIPENPTPEEAQKIPFIDMNNYGGYLGKSIRNGKEVRFFAFSAKDSDGNEYNIDLIWDKDEIALSNTGLQSFCLRDSSGNIIGYYVNVVNKTTGKAVTSGAFGLNGAKVEIIDLGNGYYGIKDDKGNTTINGNGIGGVQMQAVRNMGGGMILLVDSLGRHWAYDQNTGEYIPQF